MKLLFIAGSVPDEQSPHLYPLHHGLSGKIIPSEFFYVIFAVNKDLVSPTTINFNILTYQNLIVIKNQPNPDVSLSDRPLTGGRSLENVGKTSSSICISQEVM